MANDPVDIPRGIPTGMIDTDITYSHINDTYFFVIDGETYSGFKSHSDARRALDVILRTRPQRLTQYEPPDWARIPAGWDPADGRQKPKPTQHEMRQREEHERARREQEARVKQEIDQQVERMREIRRQSWDQVKTAYQDGHKAGYEPEEIGEILYDLVKQLLSEQGIG